MRNASEKPSAAQKYCTFHVAPWRDSRFPRIRPKPPWRILAETAKLFLANFLHTQHSVYVRAIYEHGKTYKKYTPKLLKLRVGFWGEFKSCHPDSAVTTGTLS